MKTGKDPFSNYYLGIFYYNKDDSRLFPPKRFGLGWTINFAHPWSYVIVIGFVLLLSLVRS